MKKVIGLLSALLLGAQAQAVDVSGYIDVQYNLGHGDDAPLVSETKDTFKFAEGALYLSHKEGMSSFMIDIPLAGVAASESVTVSGDKAQAYIGHKINDMFSVKAGKFDSMFGFEAIDSKDLDFVTGGITGAIYPTTHTGLAVEYAKGNIGATLLLGNSQDLGAQGATPTETHDKGVQVTYKHNHMHFMAGYLTRANDEAAVLDAAENLLDLGFGMAAGKFDIDLSLSSTTNHGGNEDAETESGILAEVKWNGMEGCSIVGRVETLTNSEGVEDNNATELAIGYARAMNKALTLKAEAKNVNLDDGTDKGSKTEISLAAVYSF